MRTIDTRSAPPDLLVPFSTRRFADAKVVWINPRAMAAAQMDHCDPECVKLFEAVLLETFAAAVPDGAEPQGVYGTDAVTLFADRYGGPGGTMHGGSGRAGASGAWNAKGIGRTPLCDEDADFYHGHGCMWMEEAIREAAFAELARDEFPRSAAAAIAIIDPGTRFVFRDGGLGEQRAVLVRENLLRLAHLERSVFFGTGGWSGSDQHLDASRVRGVVHTLLNEFCDGSAAKLVALLEHSLQGAGEQIGFGHAARLAHGDYVSSNIALDGALIDFGAFRSVPTWHSARCSIGYAPFGREHHNLLPSLSTVARDLGKYASAGKVDVLRLATSVKKGMLKGWNDEVSRVLSPLRSMDPTAAENQARRLADHFEEQQQKSVDYARQDPDEPSGTLLDVAIGLSADRVNSVRDLVVADEGKRRDMLARFRLEQWLSPARSTTRHALQQRVARGLRSASDRSGSSRVAAKAMRAVLTIRRRSFAALRDTEVVIRQRCIPGLNVLDVADVETLERRILVDSCSTTDLERRAPLEAGWAPGGNEEGSDIRSKRVGWDSDATVQFSTATGPWRSCRTAPIQ